MENPGFLKIAGMLALFCVGLNVACAEPQPQPTDSIEAALKSIKPVQPCDKGKRAKPKPVNFVNAPVPKPDLACAVLPDEVAKLSKNSEALLVDTRSQADFADYHIDGAMNIGPVDLRGKLFLSDKSLVLVGSGKAEQQLYIECNRLKAAGFKHVRVLRGGLPAWLTSGHRVVGQSSDLSQLMTLTPEELWQESQFKPNLVYITANYKALHKQIKGSIVINAEEPEAIQAKIKHHLKQANTRAIAAVILVSSRQYDTDALSLAISPVPLLVYSGTAEAYSNYLAQQPAVWAAYANGPKQPSGCRR